MSRRPDFPAGKLPPGAKVLETKLPGEPKRRPCPKLGPDAIVVLMTVDGRASPHRHPARDKLGRAFKGKAETAWKKKVAAAARVAFPDYRPYEKPVELRITFHLRRKSGRPPDLTNLIKSTEDALEGIIFVNDTQVVATVGRRVLCDEDRTFIRVITPGRDTP